MSEGSEPLERPAEKLTRPASSTSFLRCKRVVRKRKSGLHLRMDRENKRDGSWADKQYLSSCSVIYGQLLELNQ